MSWKRRFRRAGMVGGVLTAALVGFAHTPFGNRQIARVALSAVDGVLEPGWQAEVGRLRANWLGGRIRLYDVTLSGPEGPAVQVGQLDLSLDLKGILSRSARVRHLRLRHVVVRLRQDASGEIDLLSAFPAGEPVQPDPDAEPWGGLPVGVAVDEVTLEDVWFRMDIADPEGGPGGGLMVGLYGLHGAVSLPAGAPEVHLSDLDAAGVLVAPGPVPFTLAGDLAWLGDGATVDGFAARLLSLGLVLDGGIDALSSGGEVDLRVDADDLDLAVLDRLIGAGLAGRYTGALHARGPLHGLAVEGSLTGVTPTTGALHLDPGTVVCVPVEGAVEDACGPGGTPPLDPLDLGWKVNARIDGIAVEQILPSLGGPLVIRAQLSGRGGGTSWPEGVFVEDARLVAKDTDVFGVPIRALDGEINLRNGVLGFPAIDATAAAGRLRGEGFFDLDRGRLEVDATGDLDLSMLADLGVEDVSGRGRLLGARVTGDVFEEGAPIAVGVRYALSDVAYGADITLAEALGSASVSVVDGVTDVDVTLDAGGLVAYGADLPEVALRRLHVRVDDIVRIDGDFASPGATERDGAACVVLGSDAEPEFRPWELDDELDSAEDAEDAEDAEAPAAALDEDAPAAGDADRVSDELPAPPARPAAPPYGLRYPDVATLDCVAGSFEVVVPASGDVTVDVGLALGGVNAMGFVADGGSVTLGIEGDALRAEVDLRDGDRAFLRAVGVEVDLATLAIRAESLVLAPTWRQRWVTDRPLRLRYTGAGVADADVALSSDFGSIEVVGDLGTEGTLAGQVHVRSLEVEALAELLPDVLSDYSGEINLLLDAKGRAARPELSLAISAERLFVPEVVRWMDVAGTVALQDDVLDVDLAAAVDGTPVAGLAGFVPVVSNLAAPALAPTGDVDLRLRIKPGRLRRFATLLPDVSLPVGDLSGVFRLHGDLQDPDLGLGAVLVTPLEGLEQRARVELDVVRQAGRLVTQLDVYEGMRPMLALDGEASTRLGEVMSWLLAGGPEPDFDNLGLFADDLDISLRPVGLSIETLQALAGTTYDVEGVVSGSLAVRGHPMRPVVTSDLHLDGRFGEEPFKLGLGLTPYGDAEGYAVDLHLAGEDGSWLRLAGDAPVSVDFDADSVAGWSRGDLDLSVSGDGLPLSVMRAIDPSLVGECGRLRLEGALGGDIAGVRPELRVVLEDPRFVLRSLGLTVRGMSDGPQRRGGRECAASNEQALVATVRQVGDSARDLDVEVERMQLTTQPTGGGLRSLSQGAPSHIRLNGSVAVRDYAVDEVRLDLGLDNAWLIATDGVLIRASTGTRGGASGSRSGEGTLFVRGTWPALEVGGRVVVDQGRIELNTAELLGARDLEVNPRIKIHRGLSARREEPEDPGETSSIMDAMRVSLTLDLGRATQARIAVPVFEDLGSLGASATRADIETRLGGELDVRMRGTDLSIAGAVEVLDGRVSLLSSRFDLSRDSRITFLGADYANPLLDIVGVMTVRGGDVRLTISGQAAEPSVDLSSDAFGSEAELFMVLLTGRAPDDLSGEEGQAAAQALGDMLLSSVLGGVNLGSVGIEADGTVRIGVPLANTVFVESAFTPTARLNENQVTVTGEWSILPRLVLSATYGNRRMWSNVFWEMRF